MPFAVPATTPPPTVPVRGDRVNFGAQGEAWNLWEKNYCYPQTVALANNVKANADEVYANTATVQAKTDQVAALTSAAQAAVLAAQAVSGATAWSAATNYALHAVAFSLINGQNYRRRSAGTSAVDPANDPATWWPLNPLSMPIGYVTDTGGTMYGLTYGGLNTVNVIVFEGQCTKQLPQNPLDGDLVVFKVDNGRSDNLILVNAANPISIDGVTDGVYLDEPWEPVTFIYLAARNKWSSI